MLSHRIVLSLALCAPLLACRSDSSSGGVPDAPTAGGPDAPGAVTTTTVKQLVTAPPAFKTPVAVGGVVVVSHVTSSSAGNVWVQDPGGGPNSGIHVFCSFTSTSTPCTWKRSDIDALAVGDVIDVAGKYDNNNFSGHPDDYEIIQPVVTKKGKTMTPAYMTVTAADFAFDQVMGANFKPYQNALVKINEPLAISNYQLGVFGTTSCSVPAPDAGAAQPDAPPAADAGTAVTYYSRGFEATTKTSSTKLGIALANYNTFKRCLPDCGNCDTADTIGSTEEFQFVQGIAYANKATDGTLYVEIRPVTDADLPKK
jgi:hypothetical protein